MRFQITNRRIISLLTIITFITITPLLNLSSIGLPKVLIGHKYYSPFEASAHEGHEHAGPDFTVPTLDGDTFNLYSHRGKPLVLFAMASWCATCIEEARELGKLVEKYGDQIVVIALDVDRSTTWQDLQKFKEIVGNPNYIWAFDKDSTVVKDYGIKALETTLIFNQDGEVVFSDFRSTRYKVLEKQIKKLL